MLIRDSLRGFPLLASITVVALLCAASAGAEKKDKKDKKKVDHFSATAMGTGGSVGGRSIGLNIRITEYTSDEEVVRLATILKESGPEALRRELEKLDVGQISPTGRVGNTIAVARSHETENGRIVNIATARYLGFLELYRSGRSRDYPFGVVSMQLNEKEKGLGNVIVAAKIKFDKENQLVIESLRSSVRPAQQRPQAQVEISLANTSTCIRRSGAHCLWFRPEFDALWNRAGRSVGEECATGRNLPDRDFGGPGRRVRGPFFTSQSRDRGLDSLQRACGRGASALGSGSGPAADPGTSLLQRGGPPGPRSPSRYLLRWFSCPKSRACPSRRGSVLSPTPMTLRRFRSAEYTISTM